MTEDQIKELADHLRFYFGYPKYSPQDAVCQQYADVVAKWMASKNMTVTVEPSSEPAAAC